MVSDKFKWCSINVGVKLLAGPYECKRLFLCLRIPPLCFCQTTACVTDNSWTIFLYLCKNSPEPNWAGISDYLRWRILVKYPKVSALDRRLFNSSNASFCSLPNANSVPAFVRRLSGSEIVARSGMNRPQ